jgi:hypothetical protein
MTERNGGAGVGEASSGSLAARHARGLVSANDARSLRTVGDAALWFESRSGGSVLVLAPSDDPLLGRFGPGAVGDAGAGLTLVRVPSGPGAAAALRESLPNLRPVPLGLTTSAGFGDRLGMATPGHVAAMHRSSAAGVIAPIFAQQSIREMTRTKRTARQVIDDATIGAFEAGWRGAVGADADHLKTEQNVLDTVAAGFTFFTIDPSEHVDDEAESADDATLRAKVDALPWAGLEDDWASLRSRFQGPLAADGVSLAFDEHVLARAAAKYGAALAHTAGLHRVLAATGAPFELELSVDETSYPTTLEEHAYIAVELRRLGVSVVSLAPRFVGRFEKGVDFRGDLAALVASLAGHAAIARAFGPYKLSLHSGSDKFSVYAPIAEATGGLVHLKTAGTSYLEALRVAAVLDPALFRRALAIGHERFETDRKSYLIGARLDNVPSPDAVPDADLPRLLDDDDARQVLHVTFGSALDALGGELKALLAEHAAEHEDGLARHFVRHLAPFVAHASGPGRQVAS